MDEEALMSRDLAIASVIARNDRHKILQLDLLTPAERAQGKRMARTPTELRKYLVARFGSKDVPSIAELRKRR